VLADVHEPIDLLITDVIMPDQSGATLAKEMQLARPSLQVIFMSGHPGSAVVRHGVERTETRFLQKPFRTAAMLHKIRELLDGEPA
ncbi:MAG: response regulator, partial [Deltaproteobacteria bacterium]|nr:response regulator [Deltaproteobacteria bacterium]